MGCWGLLGWLLIVRQWIIPENSLRLAPVSLSLRWFTMFHEFLRMSSCSASILILSLHVSRFLVDMHTLCCLTSPIFLLPNIQQIIDLCGVPHLSWQTIRVFQSWSSLSLRHFSHFFMVSFWWNHNGVIPILPCFPILKSSHPPSCFMLSYSGATEWLSIFAKSLAPRWYPKSER